MKELLAGISIALLSTAVSAQTATELKEQSLAACKVQAESMPEAQQDMVLNVCKCTVDNTDYDALLEAQTDAEKLQALQTKAMEVAQKCATESAAS